jgi:hypothetical protein
MSNESRSRQLRIPVRLVNGQWEFKLGGQVPVKEFSDAELVLHRSAIESNAFLDLMEERARHKVLDEGTPLRVSLTVKPENPPSKELKQLLIPYDEMSQQIGAEFMDNWSAVPPSFVQVEIAGPNEKQARLFDTERGGLWLVTRGIEADGLASTRIVLPKEISVEPVGSLNHALTKLSEAYETWRISHTGNVYERVLYRERNGKWYPLDLLRNEKLEKQEQEIAKGLWEGFLAKMTPTTKNLFGK